MKSLALPAILFSGSLFAMSVATVIEDETPPTAPTNLRALPSKIIRIDWTRNDANAPDWPQVVYETTDLTNWTTLTNLQGNVRRWEYHINRFESHRFFTVCNAKEE